MMDNVTIDQSGRSSRSKRLRTETHAVHENLDQSIMRAASFADVAAYGRFVEVQYLFHREIEALYSDSGLRALLPGLAARSRLGLMAADLADLDRSMPEAETVPVFAAGPAADVPTALGWLYVAEGSNLGAALLRKEATKIGLSDGYGARHLAPTSEGPAAHWRVFTAALDAVDLDDAEEERVLAGARAAFARVQAIADVRLG